MNGRSQSWKRSWLSSPSDSDTDIIFEISAGDLSDMTSTSASASSSMRGSECFLVGSFESKSSDLAGDTTISTSLVYPVGWTIAQQHEWA